MRYAMFLTSRERGMAGSNNDDGAALRASLGFADSLPGDTFSDLARRAKAPAVREAEAPAAPEAPEAQQPPVPPAPPAPPTPRGEEAADPAPAEPAPDAVARIEHQLIEISAAIAGLASQVAALNVDDVRRELGGVVRAQRAVATRLFEIEGEICRVTEDGLQQVGKQLEALGSAASSRRRGLDLLRRQNGTH